MDAESMKAGLIARIKETDTSFDLREMGEKWRDEDSVRGLTEDQVKEVRRAYMARLADLLVVELAGTP